MVLGTIILLWSLMKKQKQYIRMDIIGSYALTCGIHYEACLK